MSKFFTPIAVDVRAIVRLLPAGAALEAIKWNPVTHQVDVHWDHGPFHSGKDFALEFPTEQLQAGKVPEGILASKITKTAKQGEEPGAESGTRVPIPDVAATLVAARTSKGKAVAGPRRGR